MISKRMFVALAGAVLVPALSLAAVQNSTANAPPAHKAETTKNPSPVHQDTDDGDVIFEQNCTRCHASPPAFPVRVTGTVIRHMRVRASLSKREEQALLRFMIP